MGNKDELSLTASALAVLWWTDVLRFRSGVRRHQKVASLLARFPTFRFGHASQGSPTSDPRRSCEFVMRSADFKLGNEAAQKNPPVHYWRGVVARNFDPTRGGGAIFVFFDEKTQEEAGADLLTPEFTHAPSVDKRYVANVVWNTIQRSRVSNIDKWHSGFCESIRKELEDSSAVVGMLRGELGRYITQNALYDNHGDTNELSKLIWAIVMLEILDFLARGSPMNVLMGLVEAPFCVKNSVWDSGALLFIILKRKR